MCSTRTLAAIRVAPRATTADPRARGGHARRTLRVALRYSFIEGVFSVVMFALLQTFAIPAILALGAAEAGVAKLVAVAALLSALAQLKAPRLAALAPSRRTLVVRCVRFQALACLAFAGAGFLPAPFAIPAAILAFAGYSVAGSLGQSPWASWMSDLVPRRARGRYFGWRNLWVSLIHGVIALPAAFALNAARAGEMAAPWAAFAAIFAFASASRLASAGFLARQHEPPPREKLPAKDFSYWQFLRKVRTSNFARFAIALAFLNAGAAIAAAFIPVYLLRTLGLDYGTYALLLTVSLLSSLLFVRFWGRIIDLYGSRLVLRLVALGVALVPLVYVGPASVPIFIVAYAIGGAMWSGLNLAAFNYVMEAATPKRRVRCFAYMNVTIGVLSATFLMGAGAVASRLPVLFAHPLQTLFLASALLRLAPAIVLGFTIRELSEKPRARAMDVLRELPGIRPTTGFLRHRHRPFRRI